MSSSTSPNHPNLPPVLDLGVACQLPANAYSDLIRTLRLTLPPPLTDTPEDLRRRDHAAIAGIAALCPANAAEANVAAQFVAASEQWKDCLRLAQVPDTTPEWAAKCRAQALSMMRQANSALRLLLQTQAARGKVEADNAACNRAAWTEHCAIGLMAEALAHHPHPDPLPEGEGEGAAFPLPMGEGQGEGQAAPAAIPEPAPAPLSALEATRRHRETDPDLIAGAERYAAAYPERAAEIRRTRKLLCDVRYFDPPESALSSALIAGTTPALLALDHASPEASPVPPDWTRGYPGEVRESAARAT